MRARAAGTAPVHFTLAISSYLCRFFDGRVNGGEEDFA